MSILDYPKLLFSTLFVPKKETPLYFPEIGWTITIPKGFELLADNKLKPKNTRSRRVIETLTGETYNYPGETKFLARYELENFFGCEFTDLTQLPETVWKQQVDDMHGLMVTALHKIYKSFANVTITVENDARQKGDITFKTFEVVIATPQRELSRIRCFSTIYKDYGLHITMSFTETPIGELMMNALRNSSFGVQAPLTAIK